MGLKRTLLSLGGLSTTVATIAVAWQIGVWLMCGLIVLCFSLIALLALTGTFGQEKRREDAQIVLAILLGRDQSRGAGSARRKLAVSSRQPGARHAHSEAPQPDGRSGGAIDTKSRF